MRCSMKLKCIVMYICKRWGPGLIRQWWPCGLDTYESSITHEALIGYPCQITFQLFRPVM